MAAKKSTTTKSVRTAKKPVAKKVPTAAAKKAVAKKAVAKKAVAKKPVAKKAPKAAAAKKKPVAKKAPKAAAAKKPARSAAVALAALWKDEAPFFGKPLSLTKARVEAVVPDDGFDALIVSQGALRAHVGLPDGFAPVPANGEICTLAGLTLEGRAMVGKTLIFSPGARFSLSVTG